MGETVRARVLVILVWTGTAVVGGMTWFALRTAEDAISPLSLILGIVGSAVARWSTASEVVTVGIATAFSAGVFSLVASRIVRRHSSEARRGRATLYLVVWLALYTLALFVPQERLNL